MQDSDKFLYICKHTAWRTAHCRSVFQFVSAPKLRYRRGWIVCNEGAGKTEFQAHLCRMLFCFILKHWPKLDNSNCPLRTTERTESAYSCPFTRLSSSSNRYTLESTQLLANLGYTQATCGVSRIYRIRCTHILHLGYTTNLFLIHSTISAIQHKPHSREQNGTF
jgi:hypothetical protein